MALALAAGAPTILAQEAQGAPEGEAPDDATPETQPEAAQGPGERPDPRPRTDTTQPEHVAAQQRWNAERDGLAAERERTMAELRELRELNADLESDRQIRSMLVGAALVLVGLVLGALIKSRPRRRDAWQ